METDMTNILWLMRNAILCLGFLFGMGTGVFLFTRKHKTAGVLATVGFLLFSLEPIADFVVYRVLYRQDIGPDMYPTLDYAYLFTSIFAFFLGSIALTVALIYMNRSNQTPSMESVQDISVK